MLGVSFNWYAMGFGLFNLTDELDQHSPPGPAISHILGSVVDQLYLHTATKKMR